MQAASAYYWIHGNRSHKPYVALTLGGHSFEVAATDKAKNTDPTPSRRTFTVVP
jgi:hypothetical protein